MTAEVAILNKMAVALAADSAVTVSRGTDDEKIFDSAHKLFELSLHDPIGIMINNDTLFFETPIAVLIGRFREQCGPVENVEEAAQRFRQYLFDFAQASPKEVRLRHLKAHVEPIVDYLNGEILRAFQQLMTKPDRLNDQSFSEVMAGIVAAEIENVTRLLEGLPDASLLGGKLRLLRADKLVIAQAVEDGSPLTPKASRLAFCNVIENTLGKIAVPAVTTGVVIAGFGRKEWFPTVVSFDVAGVIGGALRYACTGSVDIGRRPDEQRAAVLPFAQQDMVKRFLYGLDDEFQEEIVSFYRDLFPEFRNQLLDLLALNAKARKDIETASEKAERSIFDGRTATTFEALRGRAKGEIEDMVEFMPKSELAHMAEALVNLTSIKRRVSRGIPTVGGPIDVAVISKSEGFVWVKHKHYFARELNPAYFSRINRDSWSRHNRASKEAE